MRARLAQKMFPAVTDGPSSPRIGRYQIVRRLGTGGMGDVYEARDNELERRIAIKILHPDLSHRHRTRLRREALALASLSHPGIAHVYEVGEHENTLFIALEFIDGVTLAEWQKRRSNDWRAILGKYIEAGKALDWAHRMGIVHRDFKPSNVMVRHDGRVCILDFGLAKTFREQELAPTDGEEPTPPSLLSERVTVTGTMLGTPAYMSLEQLLGDPVDARSDQFSFCVALWEAMFGSRPFSGNTPPELARDLAEREPRAPANAPHRPSWLRRALVRGLSSMPEQRWRSMTELLEALATRSTGRNLLLAGGATLLAGSAVWGFIPPRDPCGVFDAQIAAIVSPEAAETRKQAFVASGFPDATNAWQLAESSLNQATQTWSRARDAWCVSLRKQPKHSNAAVLSTGASCLEQRLAKLEVTSSILTSVTLDLIEQLPWVLAELHSEPACSLATQPTDSGESVEALKLLAKARVLIQASHFESAEEIVRDVLSQVHIRTDDRLLAEATYVLAILQDEQDQDEAKTTLQEALKLAIKAEYLPVQADALIELTKGTHDAGDVESAEANLAQAEDVVAKLEQEPGPRTVSLLRSHGHIARLRGDFDDALSYADQALALAKRIFGDDSIEVADAYRAQGHARDRLGHTKDALAAYSQALVTSHGNVGFAADVEYDIGLVHLSSKEFERAVEQFENARNRLAPYPLDVFKLARARILNGLARAKLNLGELEAAREASSAAEALLFSTTLPSTHSLRLNNLIVRLSVNRQLERWQDVITDCHTLAVIYETDRQWYKANRAHACAAEAHGDRRQGLNYLNGVLDEFSRRPDVEPYSLLTMHAAKVKLEGELGRIENNTLHEAERVLSLAPENLEELAEARSLIVEGRARFEIQTAEPGRYDAAREWTQRAIDLIEEPAAWRAPEDIDNLVAYFEAQTGTRLDP